jgi:antitoxin component YwqK of YwqJK toxin-antitoxin module
VPEARLSDKAPKDADRTVADECSSSNEPVADTVIVRYPNGKPKIKKSVTRNKHGGLVSHGPFAMWDPHGNMIANGHFAMGKRHGVWSRLLPQRTAHFHEAPYQGFRAPFVWETRFEDDVLHGGWLMLDAEGRPMHSWGFDRGRLHGQVIDWYSNGKKRMEAEYEQGILNGNWQEWDQEGAATVQVKFVDGCRCRQYVEKHANGIVKVEGQLLGPAEKVRVVFNWWEGTVKTEVIPGKGADDRHGQWTYFDLKGAHEYSGEFERNVPVGIHTWWHPTGHKRMEGAFVEGLETGAWTWWHPSGKREKIGEYAAGKRTGEWVTWDTGGRVVVKYDYSPLNAASRIASRPSPGRVSAPPRHLPGTGPGKDVPEILERWWEKQDSDDSDSSRH